MIGVCSDQSTAMTRYEVGGVKAARQTWDEAVRCGGGDIR